MHSQGPSPEDQRGGEIITHNRAALALLPTLGVTALVAVLALAALLIFVSGGPVSGAHDEIACGDTTTDDGGDIPAGYQCAVVYIKGQAQTGTLVPVGEIFYQWSPTQLVLVTNLFESEFGEAESDVGHTGEQLCLDDDGDPKNNFPGSGWSCTGAGIAAVQIDDPTDCPPPAPNTVNESAGDYAVRYETTYLQDSTVLDETFDGINSDTMAKYTVCNNNYTVFSLHFNHGNESLETVGEQDVVTPTPVPEATFEVTKDWIPDNGGGVVDVTLVCDNGTVGPPDTQQITGDSSVVFTVTGHTGDPSCTATEDPNPPAGYSSAGECTAALSVGQCTITNTLNSITYEVSKTWSPANPGGQVDITLDCGGGVTISPSATQQITGDGSAFFTVTGWDGSPPACTATEDPNPPAGYTASNDGQCDVDENTTSCTITNTLNSDTFEVTKDWDPDNANGVVDVTLDCGSGVIIGPANPQPITGDDSVTFTVSGFVGDPECTATEDPDPPSGYTSTGSCAAALSAGYCTITNNQNTITYEVSKVWSPANPGGQVDITLDCGPGVTISPAATQQITGDGSAFFTVTGWDGSPPSCTATEDPNPPSGYTASNGGQCNVSAQVISCTITNTQNSDTFEVTKDWVPDNANGIVDVTLDCGPGVNIGPANPQTITGDSSVSFTVTGFVGDPLCTATEAPNPPSGYASAGTCSEDLSAGGCTITNDQNTITYEVSKVWSPANPGGQVNITLDCGPGLTIGPSATQGITGDGSAFFTVTGWDTPPACTATEDPNPPSGYTASNSGQCNVDENTTACTITNTLNTDTFEVTKDWDPDNSAGVINVTLDCGPGVTIGPANPQQITGDSSVVFTVSGFQGDPLCTATEDPNPPAGYTALDGGQCSDNLSDEGCTITNKLNSAKFIVRKLFSPSSDAGVNVAIECGGNGDISPPAATATEAAPAEFTITGFTPPLVCSAMETPVPNGYMASDDCQGVAIALDGEAECTITNTLRTATFEVYKDFEPTVGDSVMVSVSCSSGAVSPDNAQAVAEGAPAVWTVTGFNAGATCTASESVPAGYTADQSDCSQGKALVVNDTVSCTIVNTLNEADFIVYKDFEPTVADTVSVTVECTSGTVVTGAQDVAEGDPKTFHVVGFTANPEPTCTATEAQAPAGYISSGECSDGLFDPGSCTITNTLRTDDFQVIKDFDPDSDAPVTVELNCTSGTPDPASAQASEGSPAAFTVNGFTPGAVCTGMETQIPGGYSSTGQCSATIEEGSCVIYNTLNRATFTVNKDFLDDNAGQVMVTVTCTSGNVDPDGHQAVSENSPGVWEITGFTPPFSCTATEAVPDGYTPDQSGCQAVTYPDQGEFGCTITNEPVRRPFTVKKDFQPDSGASVFVELVCSGANISPSNGQPASEASPAVFEVIGGTDSMLCSGFEVPIPGGYTSTGVCMAVITAGECTIVNTLVTPSPTPTPPSATPTPSPSPTVVGEQPTPTPSPTPTSEPPTMTPTPPVTDAPTPEPTNEPTDEPTPTPTPTSSPTATPTATPTSTPTALPVTSVPATPSAGPVQFPPTGGTPGMGGSMMVWIIIAGLSCLVTGATFAALALRRR